MHSTRKSLSVLLFSAIVTLLSFSTSPLLAADFDATEEQKERSAVGQLAYTVSEVFLRGSIDGQSLFIVYGVENMVNHMSDWLPHAIGMNDLRAIGNGFYNSENKNDYVHAFNTGVRETADYLEISGRTIPKIFEWPWRSLKKIPEAYKVSFQNARDSYYASENILEGSLKYGGHAVWANVQGAYYLIIEVPVTAATATLLSATYLGLAAQAIPNKLLFQTVENGFQIAYRAVKFGFVTGTTAVAASYSVVSSTTAAVVTFGAGVGVGAYQAAKWAVYTKPRDLFGPERIYAKAQTELSTEDFARLVKENFSNDPKLGPMMESRIGQYRSTFTLYTRNQSGKKIKFADVNIRASRGNPGLVNINVEASISYRRMLQREQDIDSSKAREIRAAQMGELLNRILVHADGVELEEIEVLDTDLF